jgi:lipopolysaccharide assembly outer membrane protein LptD (OstA)
MLFLKSLASRFATITLLLVLRVLPVVASENDSLFISADSIAKLSGQTIQIDTTEISGAANDTISPAEADTTKDFSSTVKQQSFLESKVNYKSFERIHFDVRQRKVFLYGDAEIEYGEINIKADYLEIDFANSTVVANGVPDSLGKLQGTPVFTESGQAFESEEMTYNFDTRKGLIRKVITKDGEGYLHGAKIKKMPDERINIWQGKYTTCNLPHPHFEFRYTKAQVIPDNKIVTGPAYLVIEGVALPLFIPFGLFPNKTGQRSGILIPSFGESANRGFFLERGGYYWGINDYMDFTITGDIYTSGSWAVRPSFRYNKRYKYSGNFDFSYAKNILGDRDAPDVDIRNDFSVRWTHTQDAKARPNARFSANVNIVSSSFNDLNLTSTEAYLSNTFQSSISYQTSFNNNAFLALNASHQQNTLDRSVNITLPGMTFNTKQFSPFKRQNASGPSKWYENINLKYSMSADNRISSKDTLLFRPGWEDDFKYGAKHSIPISSSVKVLKHFNLTNSINYQERWYGKTFERSWVPTEITPTDTIPGFVQTDTIMGFSAARDFSLTSTMSTRLYGMYQFSKGPVQAIRHVMSPSFSFSYRPDFGAEQLGYWQTVQTNDQGDTRRFSIYDGTLYGGPPDGRSGRIGFSLNNNLEMKVRNRNDTITGTQKVVLIESFNISTSYDLARDSLNLAPISVSGRTTLFKKLNITYSSSWNPYAVDSSGRTINTFQWEVDKKLFRLENSSWQFGLSYRISANDFKKNTGGQNQQRPEEDPELLEKYSEQEIRDVLDNPDNYINWNNPWSLSINYNLSFSNRPRYVGFEREDVRSRVHTVGISGDLSITPKWKVNFRTGYDLEAQKLSYTSIDFYRDLHCWEMRFSWIPTGFRKSWTFGINVKASILRDLKYDRKKDFRDTL